MLSKLFLIAALVYRALALPTISGPDHALKTIYQFPNGTWVENLAIRSNGKILVTLVTSPEVWQIDPQQQTAELIAHFPHVTAALGIGEMEPDVFAVAVGNLSITTFQTTRGSYSAWQIDMRGTDAKLSASTRQPKISKIVDMPRAVFLNGLAVIPGHSSKVLIGDSNQGIIWQVHSENKTYGVWLQDPAFAPNATAQLKSGINGLQVHSGYVYFTNSLGTPALGRLPYNARGEPSGPVERILDQAGWPAPLGDHADDIVVSGDGNTVWYATDPSNLLLKVDVKKRTWKIAAGGVNDRAIAGDTSVRFGRVPGDCETLYISTNGGMSYPGTTGVEGGKVVAFDTRSVR